MAVGFEILHNVGDRVEGGENLFTVHANDKEKMDVAVECILAAHEWSDAACERLPLFYGVID